MMISSFKIKNQCRKFYSWLTEPVSISKLANESWAFVKAETSVRYFYYILIFIAMLNFQWWWILPNRQNFSPIWPIFWVGSMDYASAVIVVQFFHLSTALIGAIFYRHRWARFLVFLGISQFHGLESSFGQPNHQWYPWLYVSLILVFLPNVWKKGKEFYLKDRKNLLLTFWWAQALILLTYSMSGLGKLWGAYQQYSLGQIHGLSPLGFSYQIANWLPKLQVEPFLGAFFIENPYIGWPFYAAMHFVLFFSLWAAFRPHLQKLYAFLLIIFHIGTFLTMQISFMPPILLLILLFFNSPFTKPEAPQAFSARD